MRRLLSADWGKKRVVTPEAVISNAQDTYDMAHLWMNDGADWKDTPLASGGLDMDRIVILRSRADRNAAGLDQWILLAPPHVRLWVNGEPVPGIRTLADRDEIRIGSLRLYFSTERTAVVTRYSGEPISCARCQAPIRVSDTAVACPDCDVWHHQTDELPCWTYAPHCSQCPHPTDLTDAYQWTPEDAE